MPTLDRQESESGDGKVDFLGRIFGSETANRTAMNHPPFCRDGTANPANHMPVPEDLLVAPTPAEAALTSSPGSLFSDPNRFHRAVRKREDEIRLAHQIKSQQQSSVNHTKKRRLSEIEVDRLSIVEQRNAHQMLSQTLQTSLTVPIPVEFIGIPMNLHQSDDDGNDDTFDIMRGALRSFTRHADMVLRRDGVVLLRKSNVTKGGAIFPLKLLTVLRQAANTIQTDVIRRLAEVGKVWNVDLASGQDPDVDHSFSYAEVASRCLGRLDIRYKMNEPPFCSPEVLKNPWLMPLIRSILGDSVQLVYSGLILSFPGSLDQPWHQDGHPLFPEELEDTGDIQELPPYALNVFVPVTSIESALGPTEFWVGSHKESNFRLVQSVLSATTSTTRGSSGTSLSSTHDDRRQFPNLQDPSQPTGMVAPSLSKGDILIYDYRICHRGTQNVSPNTVRPMLYLMYARPWFAEHVNFGKDRLFPDS